MKRNLIWSSELYYDEESRKEYENELREDYGNPNFVLSDEMWYDFVDRCLGDERMNLDVEVEGIIVAFASLGLWHGRKNGSKLFESNVKEILYTDCDDAEWFADTYNVRSIQKHHDGTNYVLYRVASDLHTAHRLREQIANGEIDEDGFRKRTKSLLPYVSRVYGWAMPKNMKKIA